uniref:Putative 8.9 kDa family member n=1 Tax=Rhipicephalus pulchellus TaxID=72859 RepID=L7LPV2_RHIPC
MLASGSLVVYLSCLSLTLAMMFFDNVQIIPFDGVLVNKGQCFFGGILFSGVKSFPNKCQSWTCHANTSTVVVVRCGVKPWSCYRLGGPDQPFPKCCKIVCDTNKYMCITASGRIMRDGEIIYSTKPCAKYICQRGVLVTVTCQQYLDKKCSASLVDPREPFPTCCGVGKVCTR